jgi:hypothetical protein
MLKDSNASALSSQRISTVCKPEFKLEHDLKKFRTAISSAMRKKMAGVDDSAVFNVQEQEFKCIPTIVTKISEVHANLVGEICKTTGEWKCSHLKLVGTKDNPPSTERKI